MLEGSSSANQLVFNFSHPSNDTFANFIESESSKLALNAARALCGDSRPPFHTLFIIGESGLGKTHLLKAIGSHAKQRGEKVHYINGDLFARSIIKGETPHFDFISSATTNAIMKLSIEHKKPIGNGIITCLNMKQAKAREKKGREAAKALLSVFNSIKVPKK